MSYAPTTPIERFKANIAAIKKMRELVDSGKKASKADMEVLRQFSGWGGLGSYFNEAPHSSVQRMLHDAMTDEEIASAELSINSSYYTPVEIIDSLWDAAKNLGFTGGRILEGSAGVGNILANMPKAVSEASDITAVEIDSVTGNILKLLYPDADVQIRGFEDVKIPNNSVDLAITNVPFVTGLHVVDEVEKDLSRKFGNIHDFCIAKNVRKLREGGIGIFITSNGTLDKSRALRQWVTTEGGADFVGAFRLNNQTFGGTPVTSDIIIVRKRVGGKAMPGAADMIGTTVTRRDVYKEEGKFNRRTGQYEQTETPVSIEYNTYFVEHPENMAGEMLFNFDRGETFRPTSVGLFPVDGKEQKKMLGRWVKKLSDLRESLEAVPQAADETAAAAEPEAVADKVKEGQLVVNSKGEVCINSLGKAVPLGVNNNKVKGQTKEQVLKDYNALKSAIDAVLEYQTDNESDEGLTPLLEALNEAYDGFVGKYGPLNKNTSLSFLRNDVDFPSVAAVEDYTESLDQHGKRIVTTKKTDVFSKRMVGFKATPKPKDAKDGVIVSMNQFGRIDLPYIAKAVGQGEDVVRGEILDSGLAFEDPMSGSLEVSYEYLSGNVREKLAYARSHNEDGRYDNNIKALEKVIPLDIPAHLIEFSLGSDWLEPGIYSDFAKEKYGLSDDFEFKPIGGTWQFIRRGWKLNEYNDSNRSAGVKGKIVDKQVLGHELMLHAMNNTRPEFKESHKDRFTGETTTTVDKEAEQAAQTRIDEIKDEFREWAKGKMSKDEDLAKRVTRTYNDLFNAIVPKEIDERFIPEHFEGANMEIKLYPHQAKAVIRATTEPLMMAHEVGSGKTFTLITSAMEMRRLGTAKKPMVVVQNSTVGQFVGEAKKLYPRAKILTVSEGDRTQEGRAAFYAKIKYNDWDMIVVPQSVFNMIPDSEERKRAFIQARIDEKMYVLQQAKDAGADSQAIKRMEKELKDLEGDLEEGNIAGGGKKRRNAKTDAKVKANAAAKAKRQLDRKVDAVEDFDQMEIDALLIDEAHEYKHLGFATALQQGIKGVDPSVSQKAASVFLKTRSVFDRAGWKNVVFATGTPISNTAAEIWTFMRYLMPDDVMLANHIYYFDDFVRNFGNIAKSLEFATNGKFRENTRFSAYVNLPELVRIWASVADTVLAKDAEAAKGKKLSEKIPNMEGGKAQDIYLEQSPSLVAIMRKVREILDKFEKMTGKEKRRNSHIPLTAYGIAKRAAIDPRLVMQNAPDEPNSKTNKAVDIVVEDLEATKDYNGTVVIFCDRFRRRDADGSEGFNVFDDIKKKLVARGVPADKIAIIRSEMRADQKERVFAKVNSGDIRVVMGSTQLLGTGVNIQERLHMAVHMDAPDRPMDYTQRNGRILRQGNVHKDWDKTVRVVRFGVEDSLDVTAYQRLKTKAAFIDSVMDGKPLIKNGMENRTLEEEEEGLFDNPVAVLSGSQFALLKSQAERELRKLRNKQEMHKADQIYIANQLQENERKITSFEGHIERFKKSAEAAERLFPGGKVKKVVIEGVSATTDEEIGKVIAEKVSKPLREKIDRWRDSYQFENGREAYVFSFDGVKVDVVANVTKKSDFKGGTFVSTMSTTISFSCPELGVDVPSVPGGINGLRDIVPMFKEEYATGKHAKERIEDLQNRIDRMKDDNGKMQARKGKPFADQDKLVEAQKRVAEYTEAMIKELAEKEAKYSGVETGDADIELEGAEEDDVEVEDGGDTHFSRGDIERARAAASVTGQTEDEALEELYDRRAVDFLTEDTHFSRRTKPEPVKKGIGYKVFFQKDGKLYPPMVANPGGEDTPVGVWLDADAAPIVGESKTGRPQVKQGGKGTQGGSGTLAYRPGWHLGEIPYAKQFNRLNPATGERDLFPKDFVWAEVEYAADNDYQQEADAEGMTEGGKFRHSYAGLKRVPEDGFYRYRTNPNPDTDPWIITGSMRVKKVLTNDEVDDLVRATGREPQQREDDTRFSRGFPQKEGEGDKDYLRRVAYDLTDRYQHLAKYVDISDDGDTTGRAGAYNFVHDIIRIFAHPNTGYDEYEDTFFHENLHAYLYKNKIWKDSKVLDGFIEFMRGKSPDNIAEMEREIAEDYEEKERKEELFVQLTESMMSEGFSRFVLPDLPDRTRELITNYYNAIGYDTEREEGERAAAGYRGNHQGLEKVPVPQEEVRVLRGDAEDAGSAGEGEGVTVFSRKAPLPDDLKGRYEARVTDVANKVRESHQDSMLALKVLQEELVRASGRPLESFEDAYTAENQLSSVNSAEKEFYTRNYFDPMIRAVRDMMVAAGIDYEGAIKYAIAKHGLERNEVFHDRDEQAAGKTIKRRDYSGLTSLMLLDGEDTIDLDEAEERARIYVDDIEGRAGAECASMWQKVKDATKKALYKSWQSGILTRSEYENVRDMFNFYVPLRGFDEETAEQHYEYLDHKSSPFSPAMRTAKGRTSIADDPFATIGNMWESTVQQGNNNLVKQKFLNMVLNRPNDLVTVKPMWYTYDPVADEWTQAVPQITNGMSSEDIQKAFDDFQQRMEALEQQGLASKKKPNRGRVNIPYRLLNKQDQEHMVVVKSGGKEWVLVINGNPRAAQAINGLTNPDRQDFLAKMAKANRWMAANFTTRSPKFVLRNLIRDTMYSLFSIDVKEDSDYNRAFRGNLMRNYGRIWNLMRRFKAGEFDEVDDNDLPETERLFKEFMMNGGETGYTQLKRVDEYKKMVNRIIGDQTGEKLHTVKNAGRAVEDFVGFANRCVEDICRLSAYMTSRQMGRDIQTSVANAKDISVNFNKKGSGEGYGSSFARAAYLFYNAGVQGLQNFVGLRGKSRKHWTGLNRFDVRIAETLTLGAMIPFLNGIISAAVGGDDDEYADLPDWVRRNNLVLGGGGFYLTIPLSIELRAFYGIGDIAYMTMAGRMKDHEPWQVGLDVIGQVADIMPLNPVEGVVTNKGKNLGEGLLLSLVPDMVAPVAQAALNTDFTGKPIYKKQSWNESAPAYTKAYAGTSNFLVKSAEFLNNVTGGDQYGPGAVNVNPAVVEHLLEGYFGGLLTFAEETAKSVEMTWDSDMRQLRNVPLANVLFQKNDERTASSYVNDMYWHYKQEADVTEKRARGYRSEGNIEKAARIASSDAYQRARFFKEADKRVKKLQDELKDTDDKDRQNFLRERIADEKRAMVERLTDMD